MWPASSHPLHQLPTGGQRDRALRRGYGTRRSRRRCNCSRRDRSSAFPRTTCIAGVTARNSVGAGCRRHSHIAEAPLGPKPVRPRWTDSAGSHLWSSFVTHDCSKPRRRDHCNHTGGIGPRISSCRTSGPACRRGCTRSRRQCGIAVWNHWLEAGWFHRSRRILATPQGDVVGHHHTTIWGDRSSTWRRRAKASDAPQLLACGNLHGFAR